MSTVHISVDSTKPITGGVRTPWTPMDWRLWSCMGHRSNWSTIL